MPSGVDEDAILRVRAEVGVDTSPKPGDECDELLDFVDALDEGQL